uniref:Uncharacterized protein n=1 Tax=Arundo donax TaxID=35708 RepID=A0A0A8ZUU8_ARUDO
MDQIHRWLGCTPFNTKRSKQDPKELRIERESSGYMARQYYTPS